jgi:hypothetical protein
MNGVLSLRWLAPTAHSRWLLRCRDVSVPRGLGSYRRPASRRSFERFELQQWRRITGRGGDRGQAAGSWQSMCQAADEIDVPPHAALLWRW